MELLKEEQVQASHTPIFDCEVRGVWHRPNSSEKEIDLNGLCDVLDQFKKSGINLVFVEAFYHGMTLFKTELAPYHIREAEYTYGDYPDYLTAFVAEAEKRGIDVYAWVQDFYVGFRENAKLVVEHPNWLLKDQSGNIRHTTEGQGFGGYIFLDPSNREVREFLVNLYDELLTKIPKIKGLNLDYIRYPISELSENTDTGYTETAITEFAKKHSLTLDKSDLGASLLKTIKEDGLEEDWIAHRAEYITGFVESVRRMIDTNHPDKKISTAVFAEIEQTYKMKKQNIRAWIEKSYVDFVTPMVYFYDAEQIRNSLLKLQDVCGGIVCYTGLYTTFHKQTVTELAEHIKASEEGGAKGFILFDAAKTFFEATEDYASFLNEQYGR